VAPGNRSDTEFTFPTEIGMQPNATQPRQATPLEITPQATVAEIYAAYPATAEIWARHRVDLCCGGAKQLALVARAHGLDLDLLLEDLRRAAAAG
jgi:regulator of cell morphogenesis and NO signaling